VLKCRPCLIDVLDERIHIRLFVVRVQVMPNCVLFEDGDYILGVGDELDKTEHGALWYAAVDVDQSYLKNCAR